MLRLDREYAVYGVHIISELLPPSISSLQGFSMFGPFCHYPGLRNGRIFPSTSNMISVPPLKILQLFIFTGTGQAPGGPARLHRPAEHPGEQVLQHDPEQQRGGKAVSLVQPVKASDETSDNGPYIYWENKL